MPKTASAVDRRHAPGRALWLLGPAMVAGVAYLDPGNVASNMTAGAAFGYLLVWVVVLGNVMAWLIQYLSAKLGIVTGESLPQVLGRRIRRPWARRAYWLQAELVAMATDVAEVIGGAVALYLLFGVPLLWGGAITGVVSMGLLLVQTRRGARAFETVLIGLLVVIAVGFSFGLFFAPPAPDGVIGGLVPRFEGTESVLLAASILGATIMPHAIYAHSALARDRFAPTSGFEAAPVLAPSVTASSRATSDATSSGPRMPDADAASRPSTRAAAPMAPTTTATAAAAAAAADPIDAAHSRLENARGISTPRLLRATRWDVTIALAVAGTVNLAILLLAAANLAGVDGTDSLEGAYAALREGLGPVVATLFAVGLLASGLASTSVGAYAGAEIMHGLLRTRIPLVVRRLVTLVPALVILALGVDPTLALVLSQVVLSFGIPFALVPLVVLTARATVLGTYRNRMLTTVAGVVASVFLITLNVVLLWLVFTGG
ncbi:manganese transport protein [Microbacterium proteolyticum]|uniref:Manganese transport protein n=1 Tax=Microbacterium proteolyticum TaxID=1572644 RepID=A0A7W5CHL1_9MICO|nr:Nramp family divalent metal transporter [Microbacterium proteolyticum]MBB3157790.1 manganese transport protein [Microbacterium proteolyticum]